MRIIIDETLLNCNANSVYEALLEIRKYFEENYELYKGEIEDNIEQINSYLNEEGFIEKGEFHYRICFQHFTVEMYNYFTKY